MSAMEAFFEVDRVMGACQYAMRRHTSHFLEKGDCYKMNLQFFVPNIQINFLSNNRFQCM